MITKETQKTSLFFTLKKKEEVIYQFRNIVNLLYTVVKIEYTLHVMEDAKF